MILAETATNWVAFLGRLHPLAVHLPIAFIVLLLIVEILSVPTRMRHVRGATRLITGLAMLSAIASATFGWFLARGESDYSEAALFWHRWTGVGIAGVITALFFLHCAGKRKTYLLGLLGCVGLVSYSAHLGGELTHGQGYLAKYAPEAWKPWLGGSPRKTVIANAAPTTLPTTLPTTVPTVVALVPPTTSPTTASALAHGDAVVFDRAIMPIMKQTCINCHGPEKAKAKLRLDSYEAMLKGGEGDACLVPGKSDDSTLVTRLLEPLDAEEHMPPKGKPQPTADQIKVLTWWVNSGASATKTLAELNPPADVAPVLAAMIEKSPSSTGTAIAKTNDRTIEEPAEPAVAPANPATVAQLTQDLKIIATPLGLNDPFLSINASLAPAFDDAQLAKLASVAANVRQLNLAGTKITDQALDTVAKMNHLTELRLDRTSITDAGLAKLAQLPALQSLNLVSTGISDEGLKTIASIKSLRNVYLWQSKVTPTAAKTFAEQLTDQTQIKEYEDEILNLQRKINAARANVNVGQGLTLLSTTQAVAKMDTPAPAAVTPDKPAAAPGKPINTVCPISGKPVDATKTAVYKGTTIAFCCDKCLAEYQKNTTPVLSKLGLK